MSYSLHSSSSSQHNQRRDRNTASSSSHHRQTYPPVPPAAFPFPLQPLPSHPQYPTGNHPYQPMPPAAHLFPPVPPPVPPPAGGAQPTPAQSFAEAYWRAAMNNPSMVDRFFDALQGDDSSSDDDVEGEVAMWEHRARIKARLPPTWAGKEVTGSHRNPCSECGKNDWYPGEYYYTDVVQPWGADKICEDCIEGWLDLREEEDEG